MFRILLAVSLLLVTAACSSGARTGAMVSPLTEANMIADDNPAKNAVEVAGVTGGKDTNPLWTSQVGNEQFTEALKQSLQLHTLLAENDGRYKLVTELQEIKQPFAGFSMTVKVDVRYVLTDTQTDETLFDEVIHTEYTAAFGDALVGSKRLQLANEGAIKSNITDIIGRIVALSRKLPGGGEAAIAVGGF